MTGPFFVDTNVLVYADDARDRTKQEKARALLRSALGERNGKVSLQVLQEFFAAATRKLGLSAVEARSRIEVFSNLDVVRLEVDDMLAAVDLHRLHEPVHLGHSDPSRGDRVGVPHALYGRHAAWTKDRGPSDRRPLSD